ncbi:hypothetical protein LWM68_28840 [Niabella sp. W65]|nr:hypothetical protein [Niabella sp. W65]MCH7366422.1 hypothetical protein [Niabella sp. W65]ULT42142.1 hypothetical protein KRR40_00295 [Niabella sp. I65]
MDGIELLYRFMETSSHSPVIGPPHIAIYAAILKCWRDQNKECPVIIYGHSLMEIARIHGRATYHRVLRDLQADGYIDYEPSHDARKGSKIRLRLSD